MLGIVQYTVRETKSSRSEQRMRGERECKSDLPKAVQRVSGRNGSRSPAPQPNALSTRQLYLSSFTVVCIKVDVIFGADLLEALPCPDVWLLAKRRILFSALHSCWLPLQPLCAGRNRVAFSSPGLQCLRHSPPDRSVALPVSCSDGSNFLSSSAFPERCLEWG